MRDPQAILLARSEIGVTPCYPATLEDQRFLPRVVPNGMPDPLAALVPTDAGPEAAEVDERALIAAANTTCNAT